MNDRKEDTNLPAGEAIRAGQPSPPEGNGLTVQPFLDVNIYDAQPVEPQEVTIQSE